MNYLLNYIVFYALKNWIFNIKKKNILIFVMIHLSLEN